VDIGYLGSAVMFDSDSEFNKSGIPEMEGKPAGMFVSVSSTNKDQIVQKMMDLVDEGQWNKSTDVIFAYGYSYLSSIWTELEGLGFKVATFYPNSYDGIVQVVHDIEAVMGSDHEISDWMVFVKDYIAETLSLAGIDESSEYVTALYASYSGETLKLGNNGSVTVDFIKYAGGINVAEDPNKTVPTYTTDFTAILQLDPQFVLLDGYYSGTAEDFSTNIDNDDIVVFKLDKSWNSYCPDATVGLWATACLFYPDYFSGDAPTEGDPLTGPISITDSRGVITNLTGPAEHVAAFGAFATNTLVDIDMLDKVVMFDATSEYDRSGIPEVQNISADMFITVSSSNKDAVVQHMLDLVDNGQWNKSGDVVLGFGYSYLSSIWDELEELNFNVVTFYPNSYDKIVQVVADIETITGANHSVSQHMEFVKDYIAETLENKGVSSSDQKVNALYISYSGDVMYLANNGSVTVDFIRYAGGINVAEDSSKDPVRYSADITAILQLDPDFVLLDGYYPDTAEVFANELGDSDITVYKLNKSWNSYCPDATEGLWTIACLFYPDYFEGAQPIEGATSDGGSDTSMTLYAIIGIVVIALAVVMVLLMRRKDRKD